MGGLQDEEAPSKTKSSDVASANGSSDGIRKGPGRAAKKNIPPVADAEVCYLVFVR